MTLITSQYSRSTNYEKKLFHLLTSFQRKQLLKSLVTELRSDYQVRIRIMLLADEGQSQAQICQALSCSRATARYWIAVAKAGQADKWNDSRPGRPNRVNEEYLERLQTLAQQSPKDFGYPFKRWTAKWLSQHLAKELGIELCDRHINRLLKQMGLSTRATITNQETSDRVSTAGIVIRDLHAAAVPLPELWLINSIG